MAKWWTTELQNKVADRCLQLHGGYGYMNEYPVPKAWRDCRVQSIYGGTNEIMKEIIGRSTGAVNRCPHAAAMPDAAQGPAPHGRSASSAPASPSAGCGVDRSASPSAGCSARDVAGTDTRLGPGPDRRGARRRGDRRAAGPDQ